MYATSETLLSQCQTVAVLAQSLRKAIAGSPPLHMS